MLSNVFVPIDMRRFLYLCSVSQYQRERKIIRLKEDYQFSFHQCPTTLGANHGDK